MFLTKKIFCLLAVIISAGIGCARTAPKTADKINSNSGWEQSANFTARSGEAPGKSASDATSSLSALPPNSSAYRGERLAGIAAPLLDFTVGDYAAAVQSGKLVILYFYASWCPQCQQEFPELQDAFNQLATDQVIGFRVNFNDKDTDQDEERLAREFGVAYQHTKVFVKNGKKILKAPDNWDQQRYLSEIYEILK